MKKAVLFGMFVLLGAGLVSAQAKINLAFGPLVSWTQTQEEYNTPGPDVMEQFDLNLRVGVLVPIFLSESFELDPEVSLIQVSEKTTNVTLDEVENEESQTKIALGTGAYWKVIEAGQLSFKTGVRGMLTWGSKPTAAPTEYESYFDLGFDVSMPLILDFGLNKNLYVRISQDLATLSWYGEGYTRGLVEVSSATFTFRSFYQGFNPLFAVYYKL